MHPVATVWSKEKKKQRISQALRLRRLGQSTAGKLFRSDWKVSLEDVRGDAMYQQLFASEHRIRDPASTGAIDWGDPVSVQSALKWHDRRDVDDLVGRARGALLADNVLSTKPDPYAHIEHVARTINGGDDDALSATAGQLLFDDPRLAQALHQNMASWTQARRAQAASMFAGIRALDSKAADDSMLRSWQKSATFGRKPWLNAGDLCRVSTREYDSNSAQVASSESGVQVAMCDKQWFPCGFNARKLQKNASKSQRPVVVWFSEQIFVVTRRLRVDSTQSAGRWVEDDRHIACVPGAALTLENIEDANKYAYELAAWEHSAEADGQSATLLHAPFSDGKAKRRFRRTDILYIPNPDTTVSRAGAGAVPGSALAVERSHADFHAMKVSLMGLNLHATAP